MTSDINFYKVDGMTSQEILVRMVKSQYSELCFVGRINNGLRYDVEPTGGTGAYMDITLNDEAPIKLDGNKDEFKVSISLLEKILGKKLVEVKK